VPCSEETNQSQVLFSQSLLLRDANFVPLKLFARATFCCCLKWVGHCAWYCTSRLNRRITTLAGQMVNCNYTKSTLNYSSLHFLPVYLAHIIHIRGGGGLREALLLRSLPRIYTTCSAHKTFKCVLVCFSQSELRITSIRLKIIGRLLEMQLGSLAV
jgi:hypothetical protein